MPINTNLNAAPYFDDFNIENQYYRVLFKPGYAVQARELTQLQTMLQSQVEQFGDNIFKEGSIVKGCNFTNLNDLQFVKLKDLAGFDPEQYISRRVVESIGGVDIEVDYVYEVVGALSGLTAKIISASRGFETRPPDLNTFYITYLNSTSVDKVFRAGEALTVNLYKFKVGELLPGESNPFQTQNNVAPTGVAVTNLSNPTGRSFGIQSSPGIIFQKGHFLFADDQVLVVSKYDATPNNVAVGYRVQERLISALQDNNLYDNANGSANENAPGADRLRLIPTLTVLPTSEADIDPSFFSLIRYQNGNAITLRDVSQYNVLGEELARRTFEESGNYVLRDFPVATDRRTDPDTLTSDVNVLVGTGVAYVKGYRVENSGERSFIVDQISSTEIQDNQPVSFNYGSYVRITDYAGVLPLNYNALDLKDSTNTKIGETFVANMTPGKVYLFGTRLNSGKKFSDVERIDGTSGYIEVANTTVTAVIQESAKAPFVFDTGMISLKETSDTLLPVRISQAATHAANVITLVANPGDDFACDNSDIVVIDNTSTFIPIVSVATSLNNSQLTVNLDPGASAATNVTIYYNKRIQLADPYNKVVIEPYVKVTYSGSQKKYNLGFPDVFKITSIVDAAGNDFTSSFRLRTNQKDHYYDLSYMEFIDGRPEPSGVLTIKLKIFQIVASTGEYFFTINSYPNGLDPSDIPVYVSDSGRRFNLRECFDFRPYVNKTPAADYTAVTPGAAPLITGAVDATPPSFTTYGVPLIPAVNQSATTDIEYYLTRVDLIVADSYGEISLIKGDEERFAVPPKVDADKLVIAEVIVPGFPALSSEEAAEQRKREYAVKAKSKGIKNYTMKDIHSLEKKIDNLVYYVSLSQLEAETQNLQVLDENGLTRFKNGFIVDPFNDLSLANIENAQFNAAVPFSEKILMPSVKTFPIDLKYKSSTSASLFPSVNNAKVGTLARDSNVEIISQPYASTFRNCVSNFYKYVGVGAISPPYDAAYDTTTNPVTLDIDLTTPFQDFIDNLQEFIPLTDTVVSQRVEDTFEDFIGGNPWNNFFGGGIGQTIETTTRRNLTLAGVRTTQSFVGDFVTNFQFLPYMAARDVSIYMSGLRPDTQHYFFFDKVDVNAHVTPGTLVDSVDEVQRNGLAGEAVTTDSNGVLRAVFSIPAGTFFVGDRVLEIVDVDQYASIESAATSTGFVTYRAYNFSVEKSALTTSTRAPDFEIAETTTTRNLPRRAIGRVDPLAQTFFIKKGMGAGSNSVFLSKVDLFFKRKSTTNGVTVMLREVLNGYPTNQIVPFSQVHLLPASVNVSDDASAVTTFTFEAPIRLDVEKEYAVVIQPDANDPNYLIFTSKIGGTDLTPGDTQGGTIVQDWGDGVLFTSTNNSAWQSYQDEDLKFVLYRHNFNASSGTLTLTNNDNEFFTVNDITGRFNLGEVIYQEKALSGSTSATISMADGTPTITGTSLDDTYAAGDYILVENAGATRKDIFKIVSIDNASQMTVDKATSFAVSSGTGTPVVIGYLSYYNLLNPFEMHLEKSSARSARVFSTGNDIIGFDSGSTANTASIDNINLSYVQPMLMKANDSVSTTTMSGTFVNPADTNSDYTMAMKFNDNNHFNAKGLVLYSKSNDPNRTKPFDITISMANQGNVTSTPFVDIEVSKLIAYQYKITNTTATTAKYISKTIELAESLDAEDLHVIVTGYRPVDTEIKVYIRPQNAFDSDNFESVNWIELELFEGVGVFSSTSNLGDYREYKYRVAAANKDVNDVITYTSNAGDFSGFRRFAIRIDMLSPNIHSVPTLRDYRGIALT
jgi:hypothetical protein